MPKPNKYNIRAVRNELETCIRNKSWTSFRHAFTHLELELQTAVAKAQSGKSKQSSSPPLLCVLLERIRESPSTYPPIDLFEYILQACPISTKNKKLQFYTNYNPLLIAIDRNAPMAVIKLLLKYDENCEMLYLTKKLQRESHPPILKVARHLYQRADNYLEDILRLLVSHDVTKQSLLLPSPAKKKVALYYVCNDTVAFLPAQISSDGSDRDIVVDDLTKFMLLQTQQGIEIQQGRRIPATFPSMEKLTVGDDSGDGDGEHGYGNDEIGFFTSSVRQTKACGVSEEEDGISTNNAHAIELLQAAITCAHLLGIRKCMHLIQHLVYRTLDFSHADKNGNTLLHCIASAIDAEAFLEECLVACESSSDTKRRNLIQYLVAECPKMLTERNSDGDTPLHLAIRHNKRLNLLTELCPPNHAASVLSTPTNNKSNSGDNDDNTVTNNNQLPLHLAIEQFLPLRQSNVILELWNRYPEATTIRDGKYGLYPYQLVAAVASAHLQVSTAADQPPRMPRRTSSTSTKYEKEKRDKPTKPIQSNDSSVFDLDLSYRLLRAAPEVVQHVPMTS